MNLNEITDSDIDTLEKEEGWFFDNDRRAILKSNDSFDVQACAGSGKTTLIGAKLILLSEKWTSDFQGVCILSHTNVAKDEIISRLERSKSVSAKQLLTYPHFIGTIQEFVNRFLGLPMIRSMGTEIKLIDSDACAEQIYAKLLWQTKSFLSKRSMDAKNMLSFTMDYKHPDFLFNVPGFKSTSPSASYVDLMNARKHLLSNGYFFYRDIYSYAQKLQAEHFEISKKIKNRFPFVLIDEMQDTLQLQDEVIQSLFKQESEIKSIIQRYGDPDQAIFNGMDNEENNKTYNNKKSADMFLGKAVDTSNRFSNSISKKIHGLSINKVLTQSCLSAEKKIVYDKENTRGSEFYHTIFLFNDNTIQNVIPNFANLVKSEFINTSNKIIKVVGANGSESSLFTIKHYWPTYSKNKSMKKFKSDSFIECVYAVSENPVGDMHAYVRMIKQSVLDLLKKQNKKDSINNFFTEATLEKFLIEKNRLESYKKFILDLVHDISAINQQVWDEKIKILKEILEITDSPYLSFRTKKVSSNGQMPLETNEPVVNGVRLEVSTIHAVKGETHDATLVLETKNHEFDLSSMLPWLLDKTLPVPAGVRNSKFMRQLYVAMTRPKHLLCLSIHEERITAEQINVLQENSNGWKIVVVE